MKELEPFQLDYERYAIHKMSKRIAKKFNIKSVLEVPASGLKAMHSLYSLGFGEAGCEVALVNPEKRGVDAWKELNFKVNEIRAEEITKLPIKENEYDLVWNFASLAMLPDYEDIFKEMVRVSKKYVMLLCVNGYNVGSPLHRTLHRINKVEWTHGDKKFLFPHKVRRFMEGYGLKNLKTDVVNCPPWPDTVGFRDMKFHKMEHKLKEMEWESNTLKFMKGEYPKWIKSVYIMEAVPLPRVLKYPYAHLFIVIGEKV